MKMHLFCGIVQHPGNEFCRRYEGFVKAAVHTLRFCAHPLARGHLPPNLNKWFGWTDRMQSVVYTYTMYTMPAVA